MNRNRKSMTMALLLAGAAIWAVGTSADGPGYKVTLQSGKIVSQRFVLRVDGDFSGVIEGNLISSLPIVVGGLDDRWSAFLYDRQRKAARPVGLLENHAWATVPVHGKQDLFIGHPVICDNREVFLQLTQTGEQAWTLEVHNPTDAPVTTPLRINPFFDPLKGKTIPTDPVVIPAGASRIFAL